MKPIKKKMRTYSGSIEITHIGSMKFGKYFIYPVYLAPAGKCNLLSVSQLEDHGFRIFHKNKLITVCMGSLIIKKFPQSGDLYVSSSSHHFTANSFLLVKNNH
jgi:hypothetical protein